MAVASPAGDSVVARSVNGDVRWRAGRNRNLVPLGGLTPSSPAKFKEGAGRGKGRHVTSGGGQKRL